jgi:hypothetical protein
MLQDNIIWCRWGYQNGKVSKLFYFLNVNNYVTLKNDFRIELDLFDKSGARDEPNKGSRTKRYNINLFKERSSFCLNNFVLFRSHGRQFCSSITRYIQEDIIQHTKTQTPQ